MFNKQCLAFATKQLVYAGHRASPDTGRAKAGMLMVAARPFLFLCMMFMLDLGQARAQLLSDRCAPGETNPTCAERFAALDDPNIDKMRQLLGGDVTVASYQITRSACFISGFVTATNNSDSSNIVSIQAFISPSRVSAILFKRTLSPTDVPDGAPILQVDDCSARNECTAPPATPSIYVETHRCGGLHTIHTGAVAGAIAMQVQARPPFVSWSSVPEEYSFPGIIADLEPGRSCSGDANGDFYARARACNACGCSAWSNQFLFRYFRGECV